MVLRGRAAGGGPDTRGLHDLQEDDAAGCRRLMGADGRSALVEICEPQNLRLRGRIVARS